MTLDEKIKEVWYWWILITLGILVILNIVVNLILPGLSRILGPLSQDKWVWKYQTGGVNIYLPWLAILLLVIIIISASLIAKSYKGNKKKEGRIVYKEKIFSKLSTMILSVVTLFLFSLYLYQIFIGPIGTDPVPDWFWLIITLFMIATTINFGRLTIKLDTKGISLGYGVFKKRIFWDEIDDCYIDEASAIRYGGWGLRLGRVGGEWRTVFNELGGPRVVLSLNEGWIREVVFTTKNPEEVMEIIKENFE